MPRNVTLTTFFRADRVADRTIGPEHYLAGFEDEDGDQWGLAVPLEPDDVEAQVLSGIAFTVWMQLDGMLLIEAHGRGDAVNEAILASGGLARRPLDDVIRNALEPHLPTIGDDFVEDLRSLRDRLVAALELVEEVLRDVGE